MKKALTTLRRSIILIPGALLKTSSVDLRASGSWGLLSNPGSSSWVARRRKTTMPTANWMRKRGLKLSTLSKPPKRTTA